MNDIDSIRQVPAVYHRALGDVVLTGLSDGYTEIGFSSFRGIPEDQIKSLLAKEHRISPPRTSVNAFVIRTPEKTYLIDCGSADLLGPTCGRLPDSMAAAGIDPAEIDAVLLTHVHPDHSNGLTHLPDGRMLFPRAEIVLHQQELSYWFDDEQMAKADERRRQRCFVAGRAQLEPYLAADRVRTIKDGEVFPGVTAIGAHGHTPGHTAYVVSSGRQSAIIWGDTVHVPEIQVARPSIAMDFDVDPQAAVESRARIFDMAVNDDLLVAGMHVHFPGFAHMRRDRGEYRLTADQWDFMA